MENTIYSIDQLSEMLKEKCPEDKFFVSEFYIEPIVVRESSPVFPYEGEVTRFRSKVSFTIVMMEKD